MTTSNSLQILQVITDTDRRGAQVFADDLATRLAGIDQGVVTVALTHGTRSPALNVPVLGERQRGLRALRALRAEMATVDITIAHGSSTLLACALAGVGRRRPFVYRQISDSRFWAASWHRRWRVAAYLRRARHVVALSADAKATLIDYMHLPAGRITVVPNGVPGGPFKPVDAGARASARAALGLPADGLVALYAGALVQEKGVDTAIQALAGLPSSHLAIAGGGPERATLEALARQCAPGRVHFLGDLQDMSLAYAAVDVVMLTSKGGDSMPAVLIEAGLCGLPAITCPVGAIEEVVVDGVTGFVVPSEDVASTEEAWRRLADDAALRSRMGNAAVQHCRARFTIDVVADQWLEVLWAAIRNC